LKDAVDLYLITVLGKQFTLKLAVRRATSLVERVGFASSDGYAGCPERGRPSVSGSTYHSVDDIAEETELGMPFGRILVQHRRLVE
jgi:hypothetical protein